VNLTDFIAGHRRPWAKLKVPKFHLHLPAEEVTIAELLKRSVKLTTWLVFCAALLTLLLSFFMVWRPGQGTPLHDHAGKWCVECVCQGNIRVKSYELKSQDGELCRFALQEEVTAGLGEAGMLIPPFEHHILDNPFDQTAVTLHVYSQELTWCHAFEPAENGLHRQVRKTLGYTEA